MTEKSYRHCEERSNLNGYRLIIRRSLVNNPSFALQIKQYDTFFFQIFLFTKKNTNFAEINNDIMNQGKLFLRIMLACFAFMACNDAELPQSWLAEWHAPSAAMR